MNDNNVHLACSHQHQLELQHQEVFAYCHSSTEVCLRPIVNRHYIYIVKNQEQVMRSKINMTRHRAERLHTTAS
jgi:hypothetical protein